MTAFAQLWSRYEFSMQAVVVRRGFNVGLCATGVRLRSPVLFDFNLRNYGILAQHWQNIGLVQFSAV